MEDVKLMLDKSLKVSRCYLPSFLSCQENPGGVESVPPPSPVRRGKGRTKDYPTFPKVRTCMVRVLSIYPIVITEHLRELSPENRSQFAKKICFKLGQYFVAMTSHYFWRFSLLNNLDRHLKTIFGVPAAKYCSYN